MMMLLAYSFYRRRRRCAIVGEYAGSSHGQRFLLTRHSRCRDHVCVPCAAVELKQPCIQPCERKCGVSLAGFSLPRDSAPAAACPLHKLNAEGKSTTCAQKIGDMRNMQRENDAGRHNVGACNHPHQHSRARAECGDCLSELIWADSHVTSLELYAH